MNADRLERLLKLSNFNTEEREFLVEGFNYGFDLGYEGSFERADRSNNLSSRDNVGSEAELWDKMMKEVQHKRFAGPFDTIPYSHFIQSPAGLVPKANGQTRLIFHLSYCFPNGNKSVNELIPKHKCSIKYRDLDHAVRNCLQLLKASAEKELWFGVSDLKSAFRLILLKYGMLGAFGYEGERPRIKTVEILH